MKVNNSWKNGEKDLSSWLKKIDWWQIPQGGQHHLSLGKSKLKTWETTLCPLEWLKKTWQYQIPAVSYQVKHILIIWPSSPTLRYVFTPKKWKLTEAFFHNCQKQETTHRFFIWWVATRTIHTMGYSLAGKRMNQWYPCRHGWTYYECTRLSDRSLDGGLMGTFGVRVLFCILTVVGVNDSIGLNS